MENVDDATNPAGRVTRSLRKRLLSADSDTSSRPATPVLAKLASIAETTGSPSRSARTTRRNSVSTPISTPVQIKTEIIDPPTTPARRSTRRRSVSILEEEPIPPPKLAMQSKIDVLLEEDTTSSKLSDEAAQTTRSKSKSPNTLQKNRTVKIGPRSKTRTMIIEDSDSDPTVITVDSDEEIIGKTQHKTVAKEIIVLDDGTPENLSKDSKSSNQSKDNLEETALPEQAVIVTENAAEDSTKADDSTNHHITKKDDATYNAVVIESVEILASLSLKAQDNNVSPQSSVRLGKSVSFSASQDNVLKTAYPKTPAQRAKSYFNRDSPKETDDKSFQSDIDSVSCLKDSNGDSQEIKALKTQSEHDQLDHSSKDSAEFQNVTNEDVEIMPHANTPYKTKLLPSIPSSTPVIENSCELKSPLNKKIASNKEKETEEFSSPEKFLRSGKSYGDPALTSPKTSPTQFKKIADDRLSPSNPEKNDGKVSKEAHSPDNVSACSPTVGNSLKSDDAKSKSEDENGPYTEIESATTENADGNMKTSYATSWSQGVTVNEGQHGKIDAILAQMSPVTDRVVKNADKKDSSSVENSNNVGMKIDQVTKHFDEDEEEEELDYDEKAHEMSYFLDDEAMEVDDDYRSGDSMSEEERLERQENEIIEHGESIGSKDSDDDEENDDEDSDSFIVSASEEEMLLEFSEDEDITDQTRNYKRIEAPVSDSETDDENILPKNYSNMRSQDFKNATSQALEFEVTKMIDESEINEEDTLEVNFDAVAMKKCQSANVSREDANKIDEIKDINTSGKETQKLKKSNSEGVESVHDRKRNAGELRSEIVRLESDHESDKNYHPMNESISNQKSRKSQSMNEMSNSKSPKKGLDFSEMSERDISTDSCLISGGLTDSTLKLLNQIGGENSDDGNATLHDNTVHKKVSNILNKSVRFNKSEHEVYTNEKQDNKLKEPKFRSSLSSIEMSVDPGRAFANRPYTVKEVCMENATSNEELEGGEDNSTDNESEEDDIEDVATKENASKMEPQASLLKKIKDRKGNNAGLSVSFGQVKHNEELMVSARKPLHSSFTIGVAAKKSNPHSFPTNVCSTSSLYWRKLEEKIATEECSSTEESSNNNNGTLVDSGGNEAGLSSEDEEQLQKIINMKPNVGRNRNHSMVLEKTGRSTDADMTTSGAKNTKRISCGHARKDFQPSQSFVDDVSERKRKAQMKRKRISTFCDGENGVLNITDNDVPHLHKKSKLVGGRSVLLSSTPRNETKDASAAPNATNDNNNNLRRILSRCDEILEEANRAKLESKIKNKNIQSKKLKKKRTSKKNAKTKNEEVAPTPKILQVMEGQNDKEKNKQVIQKALKASAEIILNTPGKKKQKLNTTGTDSEVNRFLPTQWLETISNKKKKETLIAKEAHDLYNRHKVMQSSAGCVVEGPLTPVQNKQSKVRKIHLPTGTICEEPVTPLKKASLLGFHESPMTPKSIGYKVRQILSAGQDTPPEFSSDLSKKDRKRRHAFTESRHVLQKPKWSQSGVFIEENMMPVRTINSSGATKFQISTISGARKAKKHTGDDPRPLGAANSNALNFKQRAMHRDKNLRESSRELLQRKERCHARNHF